MTAPTLLGHASARDLERSTDDLAAMSAPARRLLAECVETQGLERSRPSASALALEDAGFIFIREMQPGLDTCVRLTPSLAGEEALASFERRQMPPTTDTS